MAANKYTVPDLEKEVQGEKYQHLIKEQHGKVLGLLRKHEMLSHEKQEEWCSSPVMLKLKLGAKLYMAKPFPFPSHNKKKQRKSWTGRSRQESYESCHLRKWMLLNGCFPFSSF
eukprot:10900838-Ditylum_brightwellii.AAC.1